MHSLVLLTTLDKQTVNTDLVLVLKDFIAEDCRMLTQIKIITEARYSSFFPSQDQTDLDEFFGYIHHRLYVQLYCRVHERNHPEPYGPAMVLVRKVIFLALSAL